MLHYRLSVQGRGHSNTDAYTAADTVAVTVRAAPLVTAVAVTSIPQASATYRQGEAIEVAVTFNRAVEVTGAPEIGLDVGGMTKPASYVRGSGTQQLVFSYTVQSGDDDDDGVAVPANGLATPAGSAIADGDGAVVLLDHDALAADTGHKVDGATAALSGGVCGRTPQVRDALMARVQAADGTVTDCSLVTEAHLGALTGALNLDGNVTGSRMTGLKPGDFGGLDGVTVLGLANNRLRDIPAEVFDPLTALTQLHLNNNETAAGDGLALLPAGVFDRLGALTLLSLQSNDLAALPPRIFEKLVNLNVLSLRLNPGTATFLPSADAGEDRAVVAGKDVTLGGKGTGKDPWGTNVTYTWEEVDAEGNRVADADGAAALSDADMAEARFTAPVLAAELALRFRLSVQGKGHTSRERHTASDSVAVTVRAAPQATGVAISSVPQASATYRAGEAIEVAVTFNRPVEVTGTPTLGLAIGADTANRSAAYVRGSGTRTLVFAYTVQGTDADDDGVAVPANALALAGGSIVEVVAEVDVDGAVVLLDHAAVAADAGHRVDGATAALTGGICDRTAQVRDALVAAVSEASDCSQVTPAHLGALDGALLLSNMGIAALKAGDFAGLGEVTSLLLIGNALTALPAGVFDGLGALDILRLNGNALAAGSLADGVFEPLKRLDQLVLSGNPGSGSFRPPAKAGADRTVGAGAAVTLGGPGTGGGPWGTNVEYLWVEIDADGNAVADADRAAPLSDADTARGALHGAEGEPRRRC